MEYKPYLAIKAYALVNFIMEYTTIGGEASQSVVVDGNRWQELHLDGAESTRHCWGGVMLTSPKGCKLYYSLVYKFKISNNMPEYEAVIVGFYLVDSLRFKKVRIKSDSRLVVGQLNGMFEAKMETMILYKDITEGLLERLDAYKVHHMPRLENKDVDILSKLAIGGVPNHVAQFC